MAPFTEEPPCLLAFWALPSPFIPATFERRQPPIQLPEAAFVRARLLSGHFGASLLLALLVSHFVAEVTSAAQPNQLCSKTTSTATQAA